ncbi:hypothetical protein U0070_007161 [Myodes glareolus]|uniref:Uncharacterized protein n=1 Tax=Myodes glareolus TaxID=447135 RepID=A0AAW0HM89_MYOGA
MCGLAGLQAGNTPPVIGGLVVGIMNPVVSAEVIGRALLQAGCQDSREGIDHGVKGTQAPARGDQMPTFLGKQNGRAEATEKRPTILLVVGPAEQFPKTGSHYVAMAAQERIM